MHVILTISNYLTDDLIEIVKLLFNKKTIISSQGDWDFNTYNKAVMMIPIKNNTIEIIKYLLSIGFNINHLEQKQRDEIFKNARI